MGENADDHLTGHEDDDQREGDREPAAVGVGADPDVRVAAAGVRVGFVPAGFVPLGGVRPGARVTHRCLPSPGRAPSARGRSGELI